MGATWMVSPCSALGDVERPRAPPVGQGSRHIRQDLTAVGSGNYAGERPKGQSPSPPGARPSWPVTPRVSQERCHVKTSSPDPPARWPSRARNAVAPSTRAAATPTASLYSTLGSAEGRLLPITASTAIAENRGTIIPPCLPSPNLGNRGRPRGRGVGSLRRLERKPLGYSAQRSSRRSHMSITLLMISVNGRLVPSCRVTLISPSKTPSSKTSSSKTVPLTAV
jgi:hypothetical protein